MKKNIKIIDAGNNFQNNKKRLTFRNAVTLLVAFLMIVTTGVYAAFVHPDTGGVYDTSYNNMYLYPCDATFVIYKDTSSDTVYVYNGTTGLILYSSTNTSSCFKYAIDNLKPGLGGKIAVREGVYVINTPIRMYVNSTAGWTPITIEGSGIESTELSLAPNSNCNMIEFIVNGSQNDGFKIIKDMRITGNKASQWQGYGFYSDRTGSGWSYDMVLENLYFSLCQSGGVYISSGWGVRINNVLSENSDGIGMKLNGNQMHVTNCFVAYNRLEKGFDIAGDRNIVDNINLADNGNAGFRMHGCYNSVISNIHIRQWGVETASTYPAFQITGTSYNNTISNINIDGINRTVYAYWGMYVSGYKNVITGLRADRCNKLNLYVEGDDNRISGKFYNCTINTAFSVRSIVNGLGLNEGDPNSAGDWNGYGTFGDRVYDSTNDKFYSHNGTGWMVLN